MKQILLILVLLSIPSYANQPSGPRRGTFSICTNGTHCQNGGSIKSDGSCGCNCINAWIGPDCSTCGLSSSFCLRNSVLRPTSCDCDCSGVPCDRDHGALTVGCQCICALGYTGQDCSIRDVDHSAVIAGAVGGPLGAAFLAYCVFKAYQIHKYHTGEVAAAPVPLEEVVVQIQPPPYSDASLPALPSFDDSKLSVEYGESA